MKLFTKCDDCIFPEHVNETMVLCCGDDKSETIKELRASIKKLESELKKQKEIADKGTKLLRLMRGDDFNYDSLH